MKKIIQFGLILISSILLAASVQAKFEIPNEITVYKKPDCFCCDKWVEYLRKHKYKVTVVSTRNVSAEKKRLGVPVKLKSCHTAEIGGYVVEGHVTHRDIKKMLVFQPKIIGIAVPGMPIGTPGMERGKRVEKYNVMSFDGDGNIKVFVAH
ncbi:DUF411 domain-containing protein [Teredinibacter turnerae]|uniref:DUF411 domain-containing protein n=1 Tax=Teredinibacter turnerae TaxID=2426 RepID=UPI000361E98C|nr:DUF411 domain-containing protein [Teredinibacter turnerae]